MTSVFNLCRGPAAIGYVAAVVFLGVAYVVLPVDERNSNAASVVQSRV
tara:strand:+ start:275 stop:418 length:144 start_codon:yes stop_codon:yes gene_type:complete